MTAPRPDTRTPGQVAYEAWADVAVRQRDLPLFGPGMWEHVAAAVLADADARRAAAGEVVVPRMQVETLMSVAEEHAPRLTRATRADITAALAAPTPKETDR